jgi:hypothetical protein
MPVPLAPACLSSECRIPSTFAYLHDPHLLQLQRVYDCLKGATQKTSGICWEGPKAHVWWQLREREEEGHSDPVICREAKCTNEQ